MLLKQIDSPYKNVILTKIIDKAPSFFRVGKSSNKRYVSLSQSDYNDWVESSLPTTCHCCKKSFTKCSIIYWYEYGPGKYISYCSSKCLIAKIL